MYGEIVDIILSLYTLIISMRVYFLAEKLCALTINGALLGTVDGFERAAEMDPADGLVCEFAPLCGFLPVRFRFDEHFLLAPPPEITLYFTEHGVAIYCGNFLRADQSPRTVWKEQIAGTDLALELQGRVRLFMENENGRRFISLPDSFEACTVRGSGEHFLLETGEAFLLLSRKGETLVKAEGRVTEVGAQLTAEVPFHDSQGHSALCTWEGDKLTACTVRALREPTEATFALALFESVLIGADVTPFLHEDLMEKAPMLREYLGDFRSVVLTEKSDRVGLCYERRERIFDIRYFRIELADGKICNIKEE